MLYISVTHIQATKAIFDDYYREPKNSRPFPLHLFGILVRSMKKHYVSDTGDDVYYQTDHQLYGPY